MAGPANPAQIATKTHRSSPETDASASNLDRFWGDLPFAPDRFQKEAIGAVAQGQSVVVTAPTGSGKTVIAEGAIFLALSVGKRAIYTTPLKALSNQKFSDLSRLHSPERVGLLTGDNSINGDAEVVVMTTEILRNMIYVDPAALDGVATIILDEVHYLADLSRGAIWEEVIIHAPPHLQMVCLSATIANPEELSGWITERRGPTALISSKHRPVPLDNQYLLSDGNRRGRKEVMLPIFKTEGKHPRQPNPQIANLLRGTRDRSRRRRFRTPRTNRVIATLAERDMLPAIYFIFSRFDCEQAAQRAAKTFGSLTNPKQVDLISELAYSRTQGLSPAELTSIGFENWLHQLQRGVSTHHAGMIPVFKETVEELFARGLLPVVFATETLSLGINMPARSVVLGSLSKYDGESHRLLDPGDYTQLTGRAGRRGIDSRGYGVVLHSPWVSWKEVHQIVAPGSHPLVSSFRPTYNMVVNLIANYSRRQALELLEASLAQFQQQQRRSEAGGVVDRFAAMVGLLEEWGYVSNWSLTPSGERLRVIYNETDLALTETLEAGWWWKLDPPTMASLAACFIYEPRRRAPSNQPPPAAEWGHLWDKVEIIGDRLGRAERRRQLQETRAPCPDIAGAVWRWAQGAGLDQVGLDQMAPGDFVRCVRQTIDLCKQMANAYAELKPDLNTAIASIDRGVVATSHLL